MCCFLTTVSTHSFPISRSSSFKLPQTCFCRIFYLISMKTTKALNISSLSQSSHSSKVAPFNMAFKWHASLRSACSLNIFFSPWNSMISWAISLELMQREDFKPFPLIYYTMCKSLPRKLICTKSQQQKYSCKDIFRNA